MKSFLHKIPGIPEHFIVLDDDMMVGRDAPSRVLYPVRRAVFALKIASTVKRLPRAGAHVWRHQFATRMDVSG